MVTAICGGTALLFLTLVWTRTQLDSLLRLEAYTQDMRMVFGERTPVDPNLVLIGIDQPEYSSFFSEEELQADPSLRLLLKSFPWSRAVWAHLIQRLGDAGAKVIALDLLFGGQGDGDEELRAALDKYKDRVVIGSNFHDLKSDRGNSLTLDVPNASVLNSSNPDLAGVDDRVGYVNIWPDRDDVLRFAQYRIAGGEAFDAIPRGTVLESLDARVLRKFGRPELIPAGSDPVRFRYTQRPGLGYTVHSLGSVLAPKLWRQNYKNGEFFRGKIVLIGPTAQIFQDLHKTPFPPRTIQGQPYVSEMLGPEIHLNIIGAALHQKFLRDTPLYQDLLIITAMGLLAIALSFMVQQPLRRLGAIIVIIVGYWYAGQWSFDHADLVIPVASPLLVLTISGVFVLGYDYFAEQFERTRVRKTLERYVSKNIVKELLDNPDTYFHSLVGVRRPVTVLFSDVRGFTTLTEGVDSALLVKQLNEYFAEMVKHVFQFEGTLDKFIGDAVMAVWGNIITKGAELDAQHAVATALAMKRSLPKLNADWKSRGMQELAFGIGINHGEAIVGNLGSTEKMEVTVIGDAVNTASRLEGLTKKFHLDLLLGESMGPLVRERFLLRTVGLIQPKGKTVPAEVYTVLGERGVDVDATLETWLAQYEAAVKLYRARAFTEATQQFENCLREKPVDYLCEMYVTECAELLKNPPDEKWNGVFVMTEK